MSEEASRVVQEGAFDAPTAEHRLAFMRYVGQGYELKVPIPDGPVDDVTMAAVLAAFHTAHAAEYGHAFPQNPVEVVNLRVIGRLGVGLDNIDVAATAMP